MFSVYKLLIDSSLNEVRNYITFWLGIEENLREKLRLKQSLLNNLRIRHAQLVNHKNQLKTVDVAHRPTQLNALLRF